MAPDRLSDACMMLAERGVDHCRLHTSLIDQISDHLIELSCQNRACTMTDPQIDVASLTLPREF